MTRRTYLQGLYDALAAIEGKPDCITATIELRHLIMREELRRKW